MRMKIFVLVMLSVFFVSCNKVDLPGIAKTGDWEKVLTVSKEQIEQKGLEKESLYYNALSLYYTGSYDKAADASRLYIMMYDKSSPAILKVLLYKGRSEEAYEVGIVLKSMDALNSSDKIQLFKVLNDLNLIDEASALINDLKQSLPLFDYCFALINGNATSMQILESLEMLWSEEGVSSNFLSFADKAFSIFAAREYRTKTQTFIDKTFDGNPQYALIIGDFYQKICNKEKALEYWDYSKSDFPNAYKNRIDSL